jgi:hypothetical protein
MPEHLVGDIERPALEDRFAVVRNGRAAGDVADGTQLPRLRISWDGNPPEFPPADA